MAEWISAKDRLPEDEQEVIAAVSIFWGGVFKRKEVVTTKFTERSGFEFWKVDDAYFVDYWMPLPEPPKGE